MPEENDIPDQSSTSYDPKAQPIGFVIGRTD